MIDVVNYYSLLDAFRNRGPSLGYRFGLERQFDINDRIVDPSLQVSDVLDNTNRFQGRTTLNPTNSLQISLTWSVDWSDGQTFTYRPLTDVDGAFVGVDTTITENGSNKASIWAFGGSYLDMFSSQLDAYNADLAASAESDPSELGDENGDGRVVLTNESVVSDFRRAFVRGASTLDKRKLLPFPRPNWNVSYSGLSNWPLIRAVVQSLTLRHSYSADYSADYNTNTTFAGEDTTQAVDLGSRRIVFAVQQYQTGGVRINERYSPLIGLDISWKGQIQTNLQFNRSNSFSLSTSNFEVSQNKTTEMSFGLTYQKTGMRLPFFGGKRLNNRASIGLTITRSTTVDQRLRLRRALESALADPEFLPEDALAGDNISLVTAHTRLTIAPVVSYQFSNRVSANFTVKYEKFDSEDSRQPSAVNIQGNFNIRVSISN